MRTVEDEVEPPASSTATPSEAAEDSKHHDGHDSDLELGGSSDGSSTDPEDNLAESDKHDEPTELSIIVEMPASEDLDEKREEATSDEAGTSGVHMFPDTSIQLHHVKGDK